MSPLSPSAYLATSVPEGGLADRHFQPSAAKTSRCSISLNLSSSAAAALPQRMVHSCLCVSLLSSVTHCFHVALRLIRRHVGCRCWKCLSQSLSQGRRPGKGSMYRSYTLPTKPASHSSPASSELAYLDVSRPPVRAVATVIVCCQSDWVCQLDRLPLSPADQTLDTTLFNVERLHWCLLLQSILLFPLHSTIFAKIFFSTFPRDSHYHSHTIHRAR